MSGAPFDGLFGRLYDEYIKRPWWARLVAGALWGADPRPMYAAMRAIGEVPRGGTILDAPCGGGLAFRELRPEHDVRYVALDISTGMLERARREAEQRQLAQVELVQGAVEALPFEDELADLTLSMNALHCVRDPAAAVRELVRCTRRGAPLVGSTLVLGAGWRQDRALERGRRDGSVGPAGTVADLEDWLRAAGLDEAGVAVSSAIATFRGRRPASPR